MRVPRGPVSGVAFEDLAGLTHYRRRWRVLSRLEKPCSRSVAQLSSLALFQDEVSHEAIRRNNAGSDGDFAGGANDCRAGMVAAVGARANGGVAAS